MGDIRIAELKCSNGHLMFGALFDGTKCTDDEVLTEVKQLMEDNIQRGRVKRYCGRPSTAASTKDRRHS